nr:hypothetical protein [Candidatus Njordarchaeota archaeon]
MEINWRRFEPVIGSQKEFRAVVNDTTSFIAAHRARDIVYTVKKELTKYKIHVTASEAPVINFMPGVEPQPWEQVVASPEIFSEIFSVDYALRSVLGKDYGLNIDSVRLCYGRGFADYITLDEKDLRELGINPTVRGLEEFVGSHRDSVVGFTVRNYDMKEANLVFFEASLNRSLSDIRSVRTRVLTSMSQKSIYAMEQHISYGLQQYILITVNELSDTVVKLLQAMGIDFTSIYRRKLFSINEWGRVECELNEQNMMGYIRTFYSMLTSEEIFQLISVAKDSNLSFDVICTMAKLLNEVKKERLRNPSVSGKLGTADFVVAAKVAASESGIKMSNEDIAKNLGVPHEELERIEEELRRVLL